MFVFLYIPRIITSLRSIHREKLHESTHITLYDEIEQGVEAIKPNKQHINTIYYHMLLINNTTFLLYIIIKTFCAPHLGIL
jgi:hypothetical protein